MAAPDIRFERDGLYILLSDIGYSNAFHWGFYLATEEKGGYVYHMLNTETTTNPWKFEEKQSSNDSNSQSLLVAVKIAVIEPTFHHHLAARLRSASRNLSNLTCRTWLLNALAELDDEGYISLLKSVRAIESECITEAVGNKANRTKSVMKSSGSRA